ncbi:MAG: nucleotidyl transferase AbiEii/AbiGii toxin family protein, partial [Patescibacteria group bacterium]
MDTYFEILPEDTKQTFSLLSNSSLIKSFYLAGGTALALQIGHRISQDLDFFTSENFDESVLIQKIPDIGDFQLEKKSDQTIIGILNNTKISFIGYKYPFLAPFKNILNMNVADIIDIACMKIDTISSRGAKRDFIDVFFVVKEIIP